MPGSSSITSRSFPIQMLISSFLISLVAEQPLDLLGPQLVDTLLDGIRAQGPGD